MSVALSGWSELSQRSIQYTVPLTTNLQYRRALTTPKVQAKWQQCSGEDSHASKPTATSQVVIRAVTRFIFREGCPTSSTKLCPCTDGTIKGETTTLCDQVCNVQQLCNHSFLLSTARMQKASLWQTQVLCFVFKKILRLNHSYQCDASFLVHTIQRDCPQTHKFWHLKMDLHFL